jgi:phospholipid/cholesterol/gamma-HCH transport system ATP-binding protein
MTEDQSVLRFEEVAYRSPIEAYASFGEASFTLQAGGLVGLHIDRDSEHVPIADLAAGLLAPTSGAVFFGGRDWQGMDAFDQAAARGTIGCVLEEMSWITSLTVRQNIMLRERHHTTRSEEEIGAEAERLSGIAGLSGIPEGRPDRVRPRELRVLEWVRAFMGTPTLVVLVFPERDAFTGACDACMALVEKARSEGTCVVWVSDRDEVWRHPFMKSADQYEIKDERWMPRRMEGVR